ncbi:MAG: T9SS type A sorting domain-containing protein [Dysgonomonas sp.]
MKKHFPLIVLFCFITSVMAIKAQESVTYWVDFATPITEGAGTKTDPYLIDTPEKLAYLATVTVDKTQKFFKQTKDIDLGGRQWTPVPRFRGFFDGGGYAIKNLTIENNTAALTDIGLFGYTNNANLQNINLQGGIIKSRNRQANVGSIAGNAAGLVAISGCRSSVNISGYGKNIGGLVGYIYFDRAAMEDSHRILYDCRYSGDIYIERWQLTIYSVNYLGGIVGCLNNVSDGTYSAGVYYCVSEANFSMEQVSHLLGDTGGVIGCLINAGKNEIYVERCTNNAPIILPEISGFYSSPVGGVIGTCHTDNGKTPGTVIISKCINKGKLSAHSGCMGGIVSSANNVNLTIESCVNEAEIYSSAGGRFGGIAGSFAEGEYTLVNCCNMASIRSVSKLDTYAGGLVGFHGAETPSIPINGWLKINHCMMSSGMNINPQAADIKGYIGGLVGYQGGESDLIENSVFTSTIHGPGLVVGGIAGYSRSKYQSSQSGYYHRAIDEYDALKGIGEIEDGSLDNFIKYSSEDFENPEKMPDNGNWAMLTVYDTKGKPHLYYPFYFFPITMLNADNMVSVYFDPDVKIEKDYDGTTGLPVIDGKNFNIHFSLLEGLEPDVHLSTDNIDGFYRNKDVGSNIPVLIYDYSLAGEDAPFYTIINTALESNTGVIKSSMGIEDEAQTVASVRPNPVRCGQPVYISLNKNAGEETLAEVFDMAGKLIVTDRAYADGFTLTAPEKQGVYVLRITDKNETSQYKLIVE